MSNKVLKIRKLNTGFLSKSTRDIGRNRFVILSRKLAKKQDDHLEFIDSMIADANDNLNVDPTSYWQWVWGISKLGWYYLFQGYVLPLYKTLWEMLLYYVSPLATSILIVFAIGLTSQLKDQEGTNLEVVSENNLLKEKTGKPIVMHEYGRKDITLLSQFAVDDLESWQEEDLSEVEKAYLEGLFVTDEIKNIFPLAKLTNLKWLYLSYTQVSDISALSNLKNLEVLYLDHTLVEDISSLSNLKSLQVLHLNGTKVKDIGPLANLRNLRTLELNDTEVADIHVLAHLPKLETLVVANTKVEDLTPAISNASLRKLVTNNINLDPQLIGQSKARIYHNGEQITQLK